MEIIKALHNLDRWAIMFFGIWSLVNALAGIYGEKAYTATDNKSNIFFLISCDIQLATGLILYFVNGWPSQLKFMSDTYSRFYAMEHPAMMLIALVLVHIGRAKVKKAVTDEAKHKKSLLFFGLAILLIIVAIPWPFRPVIGQPWFRAF
jgi:hypothetical protein